MTRDENPIPEKKRLLNALFDRRYSPLRVAVLVLLAFVATDIVLRVELARYFHSDAFRLPTDSDALLDEYLDHLAHREENLFYFIGDSTIQGQKIAAGDAVPARAAERLRDGASHYAVANLGMTGGKITDAFYVTGRLRAGRADVAVYNINYKNFGEYDIAIPLRFARLYDETLDRIAGQEAREILRIPPESRSEKGFDKRLDDFLRRSWCLYRNRDLLNAAIFGLHPRKLLKSYYQVAVAGGFSGTIDRLLRRRRRPSDDWTRTRWDPWAVETLRKYYRVETLDEDNPVFHFIRPTAVLAREMGLAPFFFMNPMNRALHDRWDLVNWPLYASNVERVRRAVASGGGVFLDYTDLAPSEEFIDNDHLNAAGAKRLAGRIVEDVLRALRGRGAS